MTFDSAEPMFVDIESTGLDDTKHQIWELAALRGDNQWVWLIDVDLLRADPMALAVGGFHNRHPQGFGRMRDVASAHGRHTSARTVVKSFGRLSHDATIVGCNVHFDLGFIAALFREHGFQPSWNYHAIDVEAMALGWLHGGVQGWRDLRRNLPRVVEKGGVSRDHFPEEWSMHHPPPLPPYKSTDLSRRCGVAPPAEDERHTALGDARWAQRWYHKLIASEWRTGHDETPPADTKEQP